MLLIIFGVENFFLLWLRALGLSNLNNLLLTGVTTFIYYF